MNDHFASRVRERIGTVDPQTLHDGILWAIREGREDLVRYAGRANAHGRRFWRFMVPDGREFVALVSTVTMTPITVLTTDMLSDWQRKTEKAA